MKLNLFFTMSLLTSFSAFSQIWTGGNPVWHYDYYNVGEWGFIKITQTGDTLIDGKICQKLTAIKHRFTHTNANGDVVHAAVPFGENYVYVSNDTVFYQQDEAFKVLFDFSPEVNDSWLLFTYDPIYGCNDSSYSFVDAVSTVSLGSETALKIVLTGDSTSLAYQNGAYNSHFGAMESYLFPRWRTCDMSILDTDIITFRCFSDDNLDYNPSGEDCEYLLTHLGIEESRFDLISVFPNPANDFLNIQAGTESFNYQIVNTSGAVVLEGKLNSGASSVEIDSLKSGLYIIELNSGESQGRAVFVKQ